MLTQKTKIHYLATTCRYKYNAMKKTNSTSDIGDGPVHISDSVEINDTSLHLAVITCASENYVHKIVTPAKHVKRWHQTR
jgi:hypothetical protein